MCVSCRQRAPKQELARLVACDGKVLLDEFHQLPGRGVYVHPQRECVIQLRRKGNVVRALRLQEGTYSRQDLYASVDVLATELLDRCTPHRNSSCKTDKDRERGTSSIDKLIL